MKEESLIENASNYEYLKMDIFRKLQDLVSCELAATLHSCTASGWALNRLECAGPTTLHLLADSCIRAVHIEPNV